MAKKRVTYTPEQWEAFKAVDSQYSHLKQKEIIEYLNKAGYGSDNYANFKKGLATHEKNKTKDPGDGGGSEPLAPATEAAGTGVAFALYQDIERLTGKRDKLVRELHSVEGDLQNAINKMNTL